MDLQAKDPVGQVLLGLLGVVVSDLDVLLGAHCSPLSIGDILGGAACSATPVCCENNAVVSILSLVEVQALTLLCSFPWYPSDALSSSFERYRRHFPRSVHESVMPEVHIGDPNVRLLGYAIM